jgi:hypothetical protein
VPAALGELQHLVEEGFALENVVVLDVVVLVGVGLTGRRRVGSGVLPENPDDLGHHGTSIEAW